MDFRGMLADQMGHFTGYDLPAIVLGMLLAALLAFVLGLITRSSDPQPRYLAALGTIAALAVALVHSSVPLSIALVALALMVRGELRETGVKAFTLRMAALVIGAGCGASAGIVVLVAFVPLAILLRWSLASRTT